LKTDSSPSLSSPSLRGRLRRSAQRWLFRQNGPERGEVFLGQRRVFILPSRPGLGYAMMLVLLFIGAVNYNLSMGFTLTFVLGACAVIDMHLTFRNLAHLTLAPGRAPAVFAGDDAQFELHLANRGKRARHAILVRFEDGGADDEGGGGGRGIGAVSHAVDIGAGDNIVLSLSTPARRRGWLQAPRVRLQTSFPLGLLRAWSIWHPDMRALVYPRPATDAPPLPFENTVRADGGGQAGDDDFAGIRAYQAGDSMRRLAWRQIARLDNGALVSKHFEGGSAGELRLDIALLPRTMDTESRLSCMARWVVEAEARALPYGFALGHLALAPSLGAAHQEACLRALALYGEAGGAT
jgi:uncharacterized protein (DUF58 family)